MSLSRLRQHPAHRRLGAPLRGLRRHQPLHQPLRPQPPGKLSLSCHTSCHSCHATRPATWPPSSPPPGPCSSSSPASTTTTTTTTTSSTTATPQRSPGQTSFPPANLTSTDSRLGSTLTLSLRLASVKLFASLL